MDIPSLLYSIRKSQLPPLEIIAVDAEYANEDSFGQLKSDRQTVSALHFGPLLSDPKTAIKLSPR